MEHSTDASLAETLAASPPKLRPWIVTSVPPSTGPLSGVNCVKQTSPKLTAIHNFQNASDAKLPQTGFYKA